MNTVRLAGLIAVVLLLVAGCASDVIMMQDPKRGQVYQCQRNPMTPLADYNANEDCARAFRTGWVEAVTTRRRSFDGATRDAGAQTAS